MRWMRVTILAAASVAAFSLGTAAHAEGVEIDCKETDIAFEAPGFTVKCKDYSRSSISLDESLAAANSYSLFAVSEADLTFLDVVSDHVLGSAYYTRRSIDADLEGYYGDKFSDWAAQDDIGDFEIRNVTAAFEGDDPMDCVAFRKLGGRRYGGINGLTVGIACSDGGRSKALETVKLFISQD
jgi:hypothetical protein